MPSRSPSSCRRRARDDEAAPVALKEEAVGALEFGRGEACLERAQILWRGVQAREHHLELPFCEGHRPHAEARVLRAKQA